MINQEAMPPMCYVGVCAGNGMDHSCTKEKNPALHYNIKTFAEIVQRAEYPAPLEIPKERNEWIIPSTYVGKYARKHDYQRESGRYPLCWLDIDGLNDDGSPITLNQLRTVFADVYCLIYTTKSSTLAKPKWRIVFPLTREATPEEFVGTQIALNRKLQLSAIPADKVNERCAQIMYLPSRGEYYDWWLNDKGRVCEPVAGFTFPSKKQIEDKAQDPGTVIGCFNLNVTVEDALSRCGYIHKGGTKWLDPNSTSGSAAIDVFGDRWVNNGATMIAAGVGQIAPHGASSSGDAFDLFCYHFNKNNRKIALREASQLYPLTLEDVNGVNLSEFTLVSTPLPTCVSAAPVIEWKMHEARTGNPQEWDVSIPFDTLDDVNAYFNAMYVCTMLGNKHRVARWSYSAQYPLQRVYQFFDHREIALLNASVKFEVCDDKGKPKLVPAFHAWLTGGGATTYSDTHFDPQGKRTQANLLNTYSGLAVEPVPGNCQPILRHIGEVLCNRDVELYNYVIKWMALLAQQPWAVHGVALVVRGQKGCGKGIVGMLLHDICGNHASYVTDPEHLVGRFNNALSDCIFLFADEAFYAKDRKHDGILKALLTNPVLRIEHKGLAAYQQENHLSVYMATNSDYAVPASSDERRYCVLDASSERIGDYGYFATLANLCNSVEGRGAFLHYLQSLDLTDYNVAKVPETEALKDQRVGSLDSKALWLLDSLDDGFFCGLQRPMNGWEPTMPIRDLHDSFLYWCDQQKKGSYERVSVKALGHYFTQLGFNSLTKWDSTTQQAQKVRILGTLEECVALFEKHHKVNVEF